jgi:DNA-directed RNA polymerase subunit alpha
MDAYNMPIEELKLSVRTYNCLKRSGVHLVGQILAMKAQELLAIRNLQQRDCYELRQQLISHGFMSALEPIGPFVDIQLNDA